MRSKLRMAFCAATMAAGLAATPALAQLGAKAGGGGGVVGGGFAGGGHVGAPSAAPVAPVAPMAAAPQFHPAPVGVPQAHAPQVGPVGGYGVPRAKYPVGAPMAHASPWNGGGVTHAPRQPRAWPGAGVVAPPHDTAQSMYHGGRHHHGRGHWRGGVWYPYALGGYAAYPSYDDDDDDCTLRKVRVHTPYGWRRVWRRVCV